MRGGWIGIVTVLVLLLIATASCGEEESLFLGGRPVRLEASPVSHEGQILVPLREFGYLVGVEVVDGPKGATRLRWRGGCRDVETAGLPVIDGLPYVSLDWFVALSGGAVRRLGRATYVETEPASMGELDVSEERVVLRFDAFVPVEVLAVEAESLCLRFHNCVSSFAHRSVLLASGAMTRVEVRATTDGGLDLIVTLREIGALRMRRFEAAGFYSVTIEVGAEPYTESVTVISEDVQLHEVETVFPSGPAVLAYARVENWRADHRIRPAYAASGLGDLASLVQMASARSAAAGIAVGERLDLFVVDGVPLSLAESEVDILAIDAFGRLFDVRGAGSVFLSAEGIEIPIDGVNRPLRYGEAVAYPPGYDGQIAEGVPGALTVLKLRSGRVVSAYQGAFVDRDPTATLIVASGDACVRLSPVSLGAAARLTCLVGGRREALENAVTIEGALFRDGIDLSAEWGEDPTVARAWNLVGTDWHGGLILLSIVRDERSVGATVDDVRSFLRGLAPPIRDAYVLDSGGSSALVLYDRGYHEVGGGDRTAVGLLLVPISE
jgi:hypothetical protein